MASMAADVAPLLDRCGRLLADLAPHVSMLASTPPEQAQEQEPQPGQSTVSAMDTEDNQNSAASSPSGSAVSR